MFSDSQIPFFGTKPHVHGTVQNREIMMIMTAIDDDDIQLFVLVLEKIVFLDSFPHKICF